VLSGYLNSETFRKLLTEENSLEECLSIGPFNIIYDADQSGNEGLP